MATDSRTTVTATESSGNVVDGIEKTILSRRSFLAGVGLGGVVGAGAVGLGHSKASFQSDTKLERSAELPTQTQYFLPAVDSTERGLIIGVEFTFTEGSGELFVGLNEAEVRHDIQRALRESMQTATTLTGHSLDEITTHVTFETPGSEPMVLRGKSWEAGLTVALAAALRQQPLAGETLVTGVVDSEGTLLPVGGIGGKARAARAFGATELVVPDGQTVDVSVQNLRVTSAQTISDLVGRIL